MEKLPQVLPEAQIEDVHRHPLPRAKPWPPLRGEAASQPVHPSQAGGCSFPVPAKGPSPGGERGGCTAVHSSSWVIFMLSEK